MILLKDSAQKVELLPRRSYGSVRDIFQTPRNPAELTTRDGHSPSAAELTESSGAVKRPTVTTSQPGLRNDRKFSKGRPLTVDDKLVTDSDGKNTCENVTQQHIVRCQRLITPSRPTRPLWDGRA